MSATNNKPTFYFNNLPQLQPIAIETQELNWWQRFCNACKPRSYIIAKNWNIKVYGVSEKLDGNILIPKDTKIDGASIPFPWFIAFITFGILRPSGILLTASIPHDVAFNHGHLIYQTDVPETQTPNTAVRVIERHEADQLFYHIVNSVNQAPVTAAISWLAVRLGWYWVKYNGKPRGGKFPLVITGLLLFFISVFIFASRA